MVLERTRDYFLAPAFALLAIGLPILYSTSVAYPFSSPKLVVLGIAVALGAVGLALPTRARHDLRGLRLMAIVTAAACLATLAFALSPVLGVSFWGRHDQEVGYLAILASLGAYVVGTGFPEVMTRWPRLVDLALVPAVLLACLSIWALAGLPLPAYFIGNTDAGPVLTMGNSTHVGAYLAAMAAFCVSRMLHARGKRKIATTALALLLAAGVVISASFAAVIALAVGVLWVSFNALRHRGRLRWVIPGATLALLALGIVLGLAFPDLPLARTFTLRGGIRGETYWIALKTIAEHPLFGVGPANFQSALLSNLTPDLVHSTYYAQIAADAHSWPLELASTYGLPFAALAAWLFVVPVVKAKGRTPAQESVAAAVVALLTAYLFGPIALSTFPLLAYFCGVAAGRPLAEGAASPRKRLTSLVAGYGGPVALVVLAAVVLLGSVHYLAVDYDVRQGDLYEQTERITSAARRLFPPLPDPYWTAGKLAAFEGRFLGRPDQAAEVDILFTEAERLDPREPLTQLQWGAALQVLERHDDAMARFRRALELYPDWPLALKGIAFSYLEEGQADLALPILSSMAALYPDDPMVTQLLARAREGQ
jgi:tetratricopeptide (TPR) repeat protein